MTRLKNIVLGLFIVSVATNTINAATDNLRVKMVVEESGEVLTDIVPSALTESLDYISTGEFQADSTFMFRNLPERKLLIGYQIGERIFCDSVPLPIPQELFFVYVPQNLVNTHRKAEMLGELNVEGSNQYTEMNKTTFIPTKKEKKISRGGIDLLSNMAMAQLNVDPMSGTVTTASGEAISLYIDMRPSSQQEISMLRAMDIETVEFLVSPSDPRFQGARYVLNYVLVKYKYGGYTVVDGQQRFIQNHGSYNVYTRNTSGKMLYDLSGGFSYSTDSHYGREEVNRYEFPDLTLEKRTTNDGGYKSNRNGYGSLRATYQSEKLSIVNTVGLSGQNTPGNRLHGLASYSPQVYPVEEYMQYTHNSNLSLSWNGNYFFSLPNQFSLSVMPSASYSKYKNASRYIENTEIINNSHDKAWSYNIYASAGKQLGRQQVGVRLITSQNGNSMTYSGTTATKSHSAYTGGIVDLYTNLKFNRFWLYANAGIRYSHQTVDGVAYNEVAPEYYINAGYNFNRRSSIQLSSNYTLSGLPTDNKSDQLLLKNNIDAVQGNPYLDQGKFFTAGLSYNYNPTSQYAISAFWTFTRLSNIIASEYKPGEFQGRPVMVQRFVNNGFCAVNDYGVSMTFNCLNSNLRLKVGVRGSTKLNRTVAYYKGTYLNYFGQATYILNQFYFRASYNSRSTMIGVGSRTKAPDYYSILAGWGNGNWNIEAFAFNPSVGNYRSTSSLTDIGPYSSWSEIYSSSYHRQFGISVRYSFSYGKKVQQGEKLGPIQGAESGLLNTTD